MASMKQYVLFNLFIISMMLRTALDKAISTSYFAAARGDVDLFWGGSFLLLVVFVIGFYHIKKAHQEEQPPSKGGAALLLISGLFSSRQKYFMSTLSLGVWRLRKYHSLQIFALFLSLPSTSVRW